MEVRRSSLASLDDEEDDMLFATEIDTSSVRQLRGGNSEDARNARRNLLNSSILKPNLGASMSASMSASTSSNDSSNDSNNNNNNTNGSNINVNINNTSQDPVHSIFGIPSPTASTASSTHSNISSPTSTSIQYSASYAATTTAAVATPILSPRPHTFNRSSSEPASITIPAEKNSYEEDAEAEFIRNRELLVRKGVHTVTHNKLPHSTKKAFHSYSHSTIEPHDSGIIISSGLASGNSSASATPGARIFGDDDDDEMISSTTSHDEIRSMDIDIDADIDINGNSDALFGGLDSFGINLDDEDPFTFLDDGGNEVVESVGW